MAVNNFDLVGFFLSAKGLAYLVAAIAVALSLFFLDHAGLLLLTADTAERRNPFGTLRHVFRRLPLLVPLGLRQLAGMLLALLPFAAVIAAVVMPLLALHDINYYLHESPPEWRRALLVAGLAGAGYLVLGSWLAARWSLSSPALLLGGASPRQAMKASWELTRGRGWRIVRVVGGWWLLLFALDLAFVALVTGLARPLAEAAGSERDAGVPAGGLGDVAGVPRRLRVAAGRARGACRPRQRVLPGGRRAAHRGGGARERRPAAVPRRGRPRGARHVRRERARSACGG